MIYPDLAYFHESSIKPVVGHQTQTQMQSGAIHDARYGRRFYDFVIIHDKASGADVDTLVNHVSVSQSSGFDFIFMDGNTYYCKHADNALEIEHLQGNVFTLTTRFRGYRIG